MVCILDALPFQMTSGQHIRKARPEVEGFARLAINSMIFNARRLFDTIAPLNRHPILNFKT
jgi:hypothetical protein